MAEYELLDVVVIGGGQAGLAMAWHLARQHLRFVVLEAGPEPGHTWRSRWDSLTLFTPAQYAALPGMPFPGSPDTYPTKELVAGYLNAYAAEFNLPIRLNARVTALIQTTEGFEARTDDGVFRARQVVVATGPFQRQWRRQQSARRASEGGLSKADTWRRDGTEFLIAEVWLRFWNAARDAAGLPEGFTPYNARHTGISWAIDKGVDLQKVRQRAGHGSLEVTSRYAAILDERDTSLADALEEIFDDPRPAVGGNESTTDLTTVPRAV